MTLEEQILKQGFKPFGPINLSEVENTISMLVNNYRIIKEIRIIPGPDAREDLKDHPNLWMIYYNIRDEKSDIEKPTLIPDRYQDDS